MPLGSLRDLVRGMTGVYEGPFEWCSATRTVKGLSFSPDIIFKITSRMKSDSEELTDTDRKTGDGDFGDTGSFYESTYYSCVHLLCHQMASERAIRLYLHMQHGVGVVKLDRTGSKGGKKHALNNPSELFNEYTCQIFIFKSI